MTTYVPGRPGRGPVRQTNPTVRDFLPHREQELMQEIEVLRKRLVPKEQELAEVRKAMTALGLINEAAGVANRIIPAPTQVATLVTTPLTIKQMILGALRDHFHDGASPVELSAYMRTEYGREVDRNSISPQLARLRQDRAVEQTGGAADPKWKLTGADQNVDLKDEEPEPEGSGLSFEQGGDVSNVTRRKVTNGDIFE